MDAHTRSSEPAQHGERTFLTIPMHRGDQFRIAFSNYKDQTYLAFRAWYCDADGVMRPSAKGVNIRVEHLPAIADAIDKALEQARSDGLI